MLASAVSACLDLAIGFASSPSSRNERDSQSSLIGPWGVGTHEMSYESAASQGHPHCMLDEASHGVVPVVWWPVGTLADGAGLSDHPEWGRSTRWCGKATRGADAYATGLTQ